MDSQAWSVPSSKRPSLYSLETGRPISSGSIFLGLRDSISILQLFLSYQTIGARFPDQQFARGHSAHSAAGVGHCYTLLPCGWVMQDCLQALLTTVPKKTSYELI